MPVVEDGLENRIKDFGDVDLLEPKFE